MAFNRVKQWTTFSRSWYLFDAKWQDPVIAGNVLAKYLMGKNKPIYSIGSDVGDYVVVINSKEISLKEDTWRTYNFFHHTGYAKGATYTPAWQFHENDPTRIIKLCTKNAMPPKSYRNALLHRLIVFPDEKVPADILSNISEQIRAQIPVPKRLEEFSEEEFKNFPRLFEFPKEFVIDEMKGQNEVANQARTVKVEGATKKK